MILGKKDKNYVKSLEAEIKDLKHRENHTAVRLLNYLHDETGFSYGRIASVLGVSQQYINNLCLGKIRAKDESIYKMMAKLFQEE